MIRGSNSHTLPCILSSHFEFNILHMFSVFENMPTLTQMEKHFQHSAFSAKSPLNSETVQPVPGTTCSISRCVEPWEFRVSLHTLWACRVSVNSLALLLVLSFPEIADNQCFSSKKLDSIIYSGEKMFSASLQSSPACCHIYNGLQKTTVEWFQGRQLLIAHKQLFIRTIPCTRGLFMRAPFPRKQ